MSIPSINSTANPLPDVQSETDVRGQAINKVGVTNIRHPFCFRSGEKSQPTVGTWRLFVSLAGDKRGTHMSRFMQILSELDQDQSIESLVDVCEEIRSRLASDDAWLSVDFPWFIEKAAPVTGAKGKLDIDVRIELSSGLRKECVLTLRVPATSLCPCSKQISDYGAHNQRCELTASVRFVEGKMISLEELFTMIENTASAQVYSVIKREDEKSVTEQAWDNPKFVEDAVRDLAEVLHSDQRIQWYRCSSENYESIHNHDAFAEIEFDKAAF